MAEVALLRSEALAACPVAHGFTTRAGGVSAGPWGPLNLARRPEQPDEELFENWRRVLAALGAEEGAEARLALLHQVHGAEVVRITEGGGPLSVLAEADAAYTFDPRVVLAVRTADCVPVLVAGPRAVAVAHAGWRGVVAEVVPKLIARLEADGELPGSLVAAVGPAISGAAYRVGEEVVAGLRQAGLREADFLWGRDEDGAARVDLRRAVQAQLQAAGVGSIDHVARCSYGEVELHSHRREGTRSGRMAGVIARWP